MDWSAADWRERSSAVWREVLAGYAADFSRDGRSALPTLVNKSEPLSVPAEFSLLVPNFAFVAAFSPAFHAYLRDSVPGASEELEEILYWSKEDFGVRPVLRLSHQAIGRAPGAVLIATTQIYADHYLDAGLTVTMALDDEGRRRGAGLLHDLGQPRYALARRNAARLHTFDSAEPEPRRASKDSRVDQVESGAAADARRIRAAEMREDGDNGIHRGGTERQNPAGDARSLSSCGRPETGRVAGRNGRRVAAESGATQHSVVWGALSCAGLSMPPALRAARPVLRASPVDFGSVPPW